MHKYLVIFHKVTMCCSESVSQLNKKCFKLIREQRLKCIFFVKVVTFAHFSFCDEVVCYKVQFIVPGKFKLFVIMYNLFLKVRCEFGEINLQTSNANKQTNLVRKVGLMASWTQNLLSYSTLVFCSGDSQFKTPKKSIK